MSTIHEYRECINHRLDCLEMEAIALEEDLHHTHDQIMQKYEGLKFNLRNALITVKQKLSHYKELTEKQRMDLIAQIDELQVQLALGKADTEQKFEDQRHKIMSRVQKFEKELDKCLKQKSTELTGNMLLARDKLDAEFAALEIYFCMQSQKTMEKLHINKEKLLHQLHEFNLKLAKECHSTSKKSIQFEKELIKGLKTIKNAFLHLKG